MAEVDFLMVEGYGAQVSMTIYSDAVIYTLPVDGFTWETDQWTEYGAEPWLDSDDGDTSYIETTGYNYIQKYFEFKNLPATLIPEKVRVRVKLRDPDGTATGQRLQCYVWDGSQWVLGAYWVYDIGTSWKVLSEDITSILNTKSKINNARVYFQRKTAGGHNIRITFSWLEVDALYNPPPETPSTPSGPTLVYRNVWYTYSTSATDPDGDRIRYHLNVTGPGRPYTNTTIWVDSGTPMSWNLLWESTDSPGMYLIQTWVEDIYGALSPMSSLSVEMTNRPPNTPSTPSGPTTVYVNVWYNYYTSTTDPDGDNIRYQFEFTGPSLNVSSTTVWYASGQTGGVTVQWEPSDPLGTYYVRARAQDVYELWSDWSPSLVVNFVDETPPSVSITNPQDEEVVSGIVLITANASDEYGVQKVEFYIDDVLKGTDTTSPYQYSWDTTLETTSLHTIKAVAYDYANNEGHSQITVYIDRHDVAVTNVSLYHYYQAVGQTLPLLDSGVYPTFTDPIIVRVTVKNEGIYTETFDVRAFRNGTSIGTQTVTDLAPGAERTLTFTWQPYLPGYPDNKAEAWPYPTYTFLAEVTPVPDETDLLDNFYADGTVTVKWPGDADGDGHVGLTDQMILAQSYGKKIGEQGYNPKADFNGDGEVSLPDLMVLSQNYGKGPLD